MTKFINEVPTGMYSGSGKSVLNTELYVPSTDTYGSPAMLDCIVDFNNALSINRKFSFRTYASNFIVSPYYNKETLKLMFVMVSCVNQVGSEAARIMRPNTMQMEDFVENVAPLIQAVDEDRFEEGLLRVCNDSDTNEFSLV